MTWHVLPVDDLIDHDDNADCVCGPDVQYVDEETGETFADGPLVVHHSLDGRELAEED